MHELALAEAAVQTITERTGTVPVGCVRLEIGRLSGVVVESIRFCFDLAAEGTPLAGARLEIDQPTGHARCRTCGVEFDTDDPILLCPACGSADIAVLSGNDLRITSVEVSPCAPPAAAPMTPTSR